MFTVEIPVVGRLRSRTLETLAKRARAAIERHSLGASEIGSDWPIRDRRGTTVGTLAYNGRILS